MHQDGSEDVAKEVEGERCKPAMPCGMVVGECGEGQLWQTALQGPGAYCGLRSGTAAPGDG